MADTRNCVRMIPANLNSVAEVGEHELEAVQGRFNDVVWECVFCGARGTDTEVYEEIDCQND